MQSHVSLGKREDREGGGGVTTETETGMVQSPEVGKGKEHIVP